MAQITPSDPRLQFKPLIERTSALILALTVGVTVALVSIAFFEIVRFITPIWQQDLPTELTYNTLSNLLPVAASLLISALLAGYLLSIIKDGRPHGPADLILAAQKK